ncbi:hypothetical protein HMN09_00459300 [Mycena chlorophos]|uniref:Uncharacterized protein n=1 Tax=Mycena chlorophos TaxID=658473 RepID=A0A8H6TIC5_MYCCL|nr:hypothetical protein HMN09_00459300 [Mycena chlorophos]
MSESSPPPSSSGSLDGPAPGPPSSPTPARKVATTPTKAPITSPKPTPPHLARVVLTASNLSELAVRTPELFQENPSFGVDLPISPPPLANANDHLSSPFIGIGVGTGTGTASPLLPEDHSEVELSSPFLESVASDSYSGRAGSKSPLHNLDTFALSSSPSQASPTDALSADLEALNTSPHVSEWELASPAPRTDGPQGCGDPSDTQNELEDDLFSVNSPYHIRLEDRSSAAPAPQTHAAAVVGLGITLPVFVPSAVGQVPGILSPNADADAVFREGSRTPAPSTPVTDGGVWDPSDGCGAEKIEGKGEDDMGLDVQASEGGIEKGKNKDSEEWDTDEEEDFEMELMCRTAGVVTRAATKRGEDSGAAVQVVEGGLVSSSVERPEVSEVSGNGTGLGASTSNLDEAMHCGSRILRRRRREHTAGSEASAASSVVSPNPSPVKKRRYGEVVNEKGEGDEKGEDDKARDHLREPSGMSTGLAVGAW